MNCSDMGFSTGDLVAFLPLGVVGGWCSMLELDSVLPCSGLVIPAACACIGLAAVYKDGLGKLVSKFCKPSKDVIMGGHSSWKNRKKRMTRMRLMRAWG